MKICVWKQAMLGCFMSLTAGAFLTNCTQEDFYQVEESQDVMEISVGMPDDLNGSRVAYDDATLDLTWEKNDMLLLKGFNEFNRYVDETTFTLVSGEGTHMASFQGRPLANVDYYVIYYKSPNYQGFPFQEELEPTYWEQTQKANNSTEHVKDVMTLKSEKIPAADIAKAKFTLKPQSSILKVVIDNLPSTSQKVQRIAWKNGKRYVLVNIKQPAATDKLVAYAGFIPEQMNLKAKESFGIELFYTDGSCYYTKVVSPEGKTYQPGGRSTATIDNSFTWKKRDTSSQILMKTFDNKPVVGDLGGYIVTAEQNQQGYWIAVKDVISEDEGYSPVITELPLFYDWESETNNLSEIIIPNTVTTIPEEAFYEGKHLASITIPNSVNEISDLAFYGCTGLTEFKGKFATQDGRFLIKDNRLIGFAPKGVSAIKIPESVTEMGEGVINHCKELISVTLPKSWTTIPDYAFDGCENLSVVNLEGLESIGSCAFYNTGFTTVKIPQSVTSLGSGAFSNCRKLVKFEGKFASQDGMYQYETTSDGKKKLLGAVIQDKTAVTVPEGINIIGSNIYFGMQDLKSVVIPKSVTALEEFVFADCPKLEEVKILSPNVELDTNSDPFYNKETKNAILYLNFNMKNEVEKGNHWYYDWKEIKFIDDKGNVLP